MQLQPSNMTNVCCALTLPFFLSFFLFLKRFPFLMAGSWHCVNKHGGLVVWCVCVSLQAQPAQAVATATAVSWWVNYSLLQSCGFFLHARTHTYTHWAWRGLCDASLTHCSLIKGSYFIGPDAERRCRPRTRTHTHQWCTLLLGWALGKNLSSCRFSLATGAALFCLCGQRDYTHTRWLITKLFSLQPWT